ncbi:MAG: hypothetical protein Q8S24_03595, partial [Eubacteriales bacterium]|nr:hypothetical protein [Eubacteriales bacterium]
ISISPKRKPGNSHQGFSYGQISIEIINNSEKPFLIRDGYIILRNEYGTIERRIYDILPSVMISENPFEVSPKSRFEKNALFQFNSSDCIIMRFDDYGNMNYDTYAKTIFIDSDNNEYHSDEIKVMVKASGDILHKVKRLYTELRNYLKKNEKKIIDLIISHKDVELEQMFAKSFIRLSFVQPLYVLGNSSYPEYDIVTKMVRAATDSDNDYALELMRKLELRDDFVEFARR